MEQIETTVVCGAVCFGELNPPFSQLVTDNAPSKDCWSPHPLQKHSNALKVTQKAPFFARVAPQQDGDKFWRMPECYIRGSTIKYLRIPDEIIDMVKEEVVSKGRGRGGMQQQKQQKGRGVGGAGRGKKKI